MDNYINYIKEKTGNSKDYIFKSINVSNTKILFVFNEVLTSSSDVSDFVLRKVLILSKKELNDITNHLPSANIKNIKIDDIFTYLNNGFLIIFINDKIIAVESRIVLERGITTIESELSVVGSKDSFSENFNTNLGLIRRRIKSNNLWWKEVTLGRESLTKIGILYMNNIVDMNIVNSVLEKLNQIDIDGIIDSSYLKDILESDNIFPTVNLTERPDKASQALLEGKVVILVDTTSYSIILPNFFIDYFHTVDDYYQKSFNTTLIRLIRVFAFFIAIFVPAYYIAITTYNQDSIFLPILLLLKAQRASVPYPATIESLFMIISFEILRESDLRMSSTTGSAISILGGLILGDAAVSAGIMSPIMIIVIALSSIAGFVFTSIELVNAIRIYRIIFILLASILGIYGIYLGAIFLLYKLITLKSFNKPYLAPFSPFIYKEQKDAIIKERNVGIKYRNPILTSNKKRGRYN